MSLGRKIAKIFYAIVPAFHCACIRPFGGVSSICGGWKKQVDCVIIFRWFIMVNKGMLRNKMPVRESEQAMINGKE